MKQELTLSAAQQDGKSLREHLTAVQQKTGRVPEELKNQISCPESLDELWEWFCELDSTRSVGFGYSLISYSEMKAYFSLNFIEPSKTEIAILRKLDITKGHHVADSQQKEKNKPKNNKPK